MKDLQELCKHGIWSGGAVACKGFDTADLQEGLICITYTVAAPNMWSRLSQ
jgi:hypothetical protein